MFDLTKLSAAKLALVFNAVTDGAPVKKFESTPRALERTLAEMARMGVDADEAARRAGLAFHAVNLATGNVVALPSVHDRLRTVDGDPVKAARAVAAAAVAQLQAERVTAAPKPAVANDTGPARTNATLPAVLAVLQSERGATLADMTTASQWRAPFEVRNLMLAAKKLGWAVTNNGAPGETRRYFVTKVGTA